MEAGTAAVGHLARHPDIYQRLDTAGDRLAAAVNGFCEEQQLPAQMKQVGSMFHMFFQREPIDSMRDVRTDGREAGKAFYLHALNRGVLVPGTHRAFLSAAHGDAEIDRLIDVFRSSLTDVREEGLFDS
jgi:glutamate-1-semialdehyde 2,1-aminomutase